MGQPKTPLPLPLSPETYNLIEHEANMRGISSEQFVAQVVEDHFLNTRDSGFTPRRDLDPQDWDSLEEQFEDLS